MAGADLVKPKDTTAPTPASRAASKFETLCMRPSPAISIFESSGYSECLDRISAIGGTRLPLATYRLQFNAKFRFADAELLRGYLVSLSISHCYGSPLLQAR